MSPVLPPGFTIPPGDRFSLAQVAEISGFGRWSIEAGCRAKRIKHHRMPGGRKRYLTRDQLVEFLASTLIDIEATPKVRLVGITKAEKQRIKEHRDGVARRLARKQRGAAA